MSAECRSIDVKEVQYIVKDLCIKACTDLNEDLRDAIVHAQEIEESSTGKAVLAQLIKNAEIAQSESIPICQDTGYTVIVLEVGQNIAFTGGVLYAAIEEGVRKAYTEGYLIKSIIENPITSPRNTNDNTPPIIHTEIVPGETVKITVLPKGAGPRT